MGLRREMPDDKTAAKPTGRSSASAGLEENLSLLSANMEKLVAETMESLSLRGIDAYDLAPLMKLRDAVRGLDQVASAATSALKGERQTTPAEPAPLPAAAPAVVQTAPDTQPPQQNLYDRSGRREKIEEASDTLLARASAIIDLLVHGGQSPEHAAQIITRQLLAVGIRLPKSGGDARAWKRLYNWRNNLIHYKRSGPAWDAYCAFKEELANIPPDQRLRMAVGERLWDRRQVEFSGQETA